MVSMDAERTIGTRVYLKMGQNMLRAYTEPNISVKRACPPSMVSSIVSKVLENMAHDFWI